MAARQSHSEDRYAQLSSGASWLISGCILLVSSHSIRRFQWIEASAFHTLNSAWMDYLARTTRRCDQDAPNN
jgi:hypothetical protein